MNKKQFLKQKKLNEKLRRLIIENEKLKKEAEEREKLIVDLK